jgi:hypothetical protein
MISSYSLVFLFKETYQKLTLMNRMDYNMAKRVSEIKAQLRKDLNPKVNEIKAVLFSPSKGFGKKDSTIKLIGLKEPDQLIVEDLDGISDEVKEKEKPNQ